MLVTSSNVVLLENELLNIISIVQTNIFKHKRIKMSPHGALRTLDGAGGLQVLVQVGHEQPRKLLGVTGLELPGPPPPLLLLPPSAI